MLSRLVGFGRGRRHERAGFELYGTAVTAARDPHLYLVVGVPDTLDGRFDLIALHAFLLVRQLGRLPPPGADLGQAVFDAMFSDMDLNLREMGVGDLAVGRRVRAMWEAFHGRANAYTTALDAGDAHALEAAVARNVWRGEPSLPGAAAALTRLVIAQAEFLGGQRHGDLLAGAARFLPAAAAAR